TPGLHHSITEVSRIIRQLHDVIEISGLVVTSDLQHVHEPVMGARDRFELLNAFELSFVGKFVRERIAIYDFDCAIGSRSVACKPNLAIGAAANRAEELMLRNDRLRMARRGCRWFRFRATCWREVGVEGFAHGRSGPQGWLYWRMPKISHAEPALAAAMQL